MANGPAPQPGKARSLLCLRVPAQPVSLLSLACSRSRVHPVDYRTGGLLAGRELVPPGDAGRGHP